MKKNLLNLLAIATIAVVSCQSEKEYFGSETTTPGEVVAIQLSPVLPTGIKPLSSGDGGAGTLDDQNYALRYILEVWSKDATPVLVDRQIEVADDFTTAVNFEVSLPAKTYQFVFWADFTDIGSPEADLTYKTDNAGGLKDIEWKATTYAVSNDLRDAYTAVEEIDLTTPQNMPITLHRPFGKLRILATDLQDAITNDGIPTPTKAVLKYNHTVTPVFRKSFNALTGLPNAATIDASGNLECEPKYEGSVTVAGQTFNDIWLLAFDYFLVPSDLTAVSFDIELFDGSSSLAQAKSVSNAPVGANKLTTVIGGMFTKNTADLQVSIKDEFDN
jgi:hypothetical protein